MKTFSCPACKKPLATAPGQVLDPKDGVSMWCPHLDCPAQEVAGHGANEEKAFEVVMAKFRPLNNE